MRSDVCHSKVSWCVGDDGREDEGNERRIDMGMCEEMRTASFQMSQ